MKLTDMFKNKKEKERDKDNKKYREESDLAIKNAQKLIYQSGGKIQNIIELPAGQDGSARATEIVFSHPLNDKNFIISLTRIQGNSKKDVWIMTKKPFKTPNIHYESNFTTYVNTMKDTKESFENKIKKL